MTWTSATRAAAGCTLSYVLGYSRRQYLRFVEAADFATTVREHVRAFEHLGGVAASCLYDNMKVVVSSHDGEQPIYNTRFLAFATYYGFRPVACRRRRPETKGKIERPLSALFLVMQSHDRQRLTRLVILLRKAAQIVAKHFA